VLVDAEIQVTAQARNGTYPGARSDQIRTLFLTARPKLVALASSLTQNPEGAADVVQDAFVRALNASSFPVAPDEQLFYMIRVVINVARNRARREAVAGRAFPWLHRPVRFDEHLGEGHDETGRLLDSIAHLSIRQREAIYLRYWLDLSIVDTAAAMGVSKGAVKTHTARAMSQLKSAIGDPR